MCFCDATDNYYFTAFGHEKNGSEQRERSPNHDKVMRQANLESMKRGYIPTEQIDRDPLKQLSSWDHGVQSRQVGIVLLGQL